MSESVSKMFFKLRLNGLFFVSGGKKMKPCVTQRKCFVVVTGEACDSQARHSTHLCPVLSSNKR